MKYNFSFISQILQFLDKIASKLIDLHTYVHGQLSPYHTFMYDLAVVHYIAVKFKMGKYHHFDM